jgi:hypothetical protein
MRAATVLFVSLPFLSLIWRRTVPGKRCIFNFESVLEFRVSLECLRYEFRGEAFLETANCIARICNRTEGQSYKIM